MCSALSRARGKRSYPCVASFYTRSVVSAGSKQHHPSSYTKPAEPFSAVLGNTLILQCTRKANINMRDTSEATCTLLKNYTEPDA